MSCVSGVPPSVVRDASTVPVPLSVKPPGVTRNQRVLGGTASGLVGARGGTARSGGTGNAGVTDKAAALAQGGRSGLAVTGPGKSSSDDDADGSGNPAGAGNAERGAFMALTGTELIGVIVTLVEGAVSGVIAGTNGSTRETGAVPPPAHAPTGARVEASCRSVVADGAPGGSTVPSPAEVPTRTPA